MDKHDSVVASYLKQIEKIMEQSEQLKMLALDPKQLHRIQFLHAKLPRHMDRLNALLNRFLGELSL